MLGVANTFVMVGTTAATVSVAVLDAEPVAASVLATPDEVFGNTPGTLLVTNNVTVHTPPETELAGIVSPLNTRLPVWLLAKLLALAPVQVPPAVCAPLTRMLVSTSVKFADVSEIEFGLVMLNVIVVVPFAAMDDGLNDLAMVGTAVVTVTQAGVTLLVRLLVDVMLVARLVNAAGLLAQLEFTWPARLRTCTSIKHEF